MSRLYELLQDADHLANLQDAADEAVRERDAAKDKVPAPYRKPTKEQQR